MSRMAKVPLPQELVDDITARLPVKSIIRFESVCKGWQSQFRSPYFIDMHHHYHQQDDDPDVVHKIKISDLFNMAPELWNGQTPPTDPLYHCTASRVRRSQYCKVSVNGPLNNSVYCITSICGSNLKTAKVALCNPSIHQFKFLPPFPPQFIPADLVSCRIVSGFGTATSSSGSGYSVVVIVNYSSGPRFFQNSFLAFLYTPEKGHWEKILEKRTVGAQGFTGRGEIMNFRSPMEVCPQRFFKDCWHWMVIKSGGYGESPFNVLSFNFAYQSFQLMAGPPIHYSQYLEADVIVLHNHLAVIHSYMHQVDVDDWIRADFEVWMMMEYGVEASWTRIYNIHPNSLGQKRDRLYRIDYSLVDGEEDGNGVRIEKLSFQSPCQRTLSSYHDQGGHASNFGFPDEFSYCFSMGGISTYRATLERV